MHRYIWPPVVVALLVAQTVFAQLPSAIPATQGISAERLARMDTVIAASIEKNARLIGISFGNPYILMSFPKLQTYMVAYGDMPSLQEAAAESLLGQHEIRGHLPISLPGMYPRGTGIQLKAAR